MDVASVAVDVPTRSPSGATNAYVVGRTDALLVDPAARDDDLDAVLADREVGHVAVTHHHPDHVGGVADYAREHGATVWARTGRAAEFAAAAGVGPDRTFAEGTEIPVDDGPLRVLDTPGHAPEHVAFAFPMGGEIAVAAGDLAVETGSVVVGAPEGDMRAYLTSLRRLHARGPALLYPGHGPAIETPRATLERLVAHRLDRERRVLAAVREGARTPDEIVDAAYEKDLTGVVDLARSTVAAHLDKLAVQGRLEWNGSRASPT